jgi:hypothetical protein
MEGGPLDGVPVVNFTNESGRFATKLLAEYDASVVRLRQGVAPDGLVQAAPRHIAASRSGHRLGRLSVRAIRE